MRTGFCYKSDFQYTEYIQERGYEYQYYADRCKILDNECKQSFSLELTAYLNFLCDSSRLDNIADEYTGKESNDRHKHTIADKVKEVKELHTEDFNSAKHPVAEG